MGEEHSTVSSITSSSCHIFLNIILSFIVKPSFSLRLKFEIITYFQGSIIDPRSRKERKNETDKLRAQRSGPQLKRRSKGAQTKNPATRFELPDFERSGLRSDAVVPVAGLEPARHRWRWILSPLRLPIPSHRHIVVNRIPNMFSLAREPATCIL